MLRIEMMCDGFDSSISHKLRALDTCLHCLNTQFDRLTLKNEIIIDKEQTTFVEPFIQINDSGKSPTKTTTLALNHHKIYALRQMQKLCDDALDLVVHIADLLLLRNRYETYRRINVLLNTLLTNGE